MYSNQQPKKTRIDYVDLAKGFCIILVVLHHVGAANGSSLEINTYDRVFRMPLYFFLSGLFFKEYEGLLGFSKRKINKLLIPFLFWFALYNVILPVVGLCFGVKLIDAEIISLNNLLGFLYPESISNMALWFLWCLFILNMFYYVIIILSKKCGKYNLSFIILSSSALGVVGYAMGRANINLYGYVDSALTALPFFCLGYIFNRYTSILIANKYDRFNTLFVIILVTIVYFTKCRLNYRTNTYNASILTVYIGGLAGTLCVMLFSKMIKELPLISYWGRYSIMILVTHLPLVKVFLFAINKLHLSQTATTIITTSIMMLSYTCIIPLMKKLLPYVTAQKGVIKI